MRLICVKVDRDHLCKVSPTGTHSSPMEYSTTFAAGTLLYDESLRVLQAADGVGGVQDVSEDVLDISSQSGRERRLMEVQRRLAAVEEEVLNDFLDLSVAEQRVVLYYAAVKAYDLIHDLHMHVVLPAWRSIMQEVHRADIQRFLDERSADHPEIDTWSESTIDKVQQVFRKMLRQVGMLTSDNQLQPVRLSEGFWTRFVRAGDLWFLEAMLVPKNVQRSAIEIVRS